MNDSLRESLDRTLLLMRDELRPNVSTLDLLVALTRTEVVLVANAENLVSHPAQCAFATAALLMARSGQRVYLTAPDVQLLGYQPPLKERTLVSALLEVGRDLLPGIEFSIDPPAHSVDLCVTFGDSPATVSAHRTIALNASAWSGWLGLSRAATRWREALWPMGGLAAGALAAGEAFKVSMHRLRRFARAPKQFERMFALSSSIRFDLAPADTALVAQVGMLDFVSGGAITNAALFCLLRIPGLRGAARIIEATMSDSSNLNRYKLLRGSDVSAPKIHTLLRLQSVDFRLLAIAARYDEHSAAALAPLAPRVLVGVDHIPTRWFVQQMQPRWLGIGATTHWNAMASFHQDGFACARCLHPRDDDDDARIPTVALVSFWSGLLLVTYLLRTVAGVTPSAAEQHVFLTPLRPEPEAVWRGSVVRRPKCPVCGGSAVAA